MRKVILAYFIAEWVRCRFGVGPFAWRSNPEPTVDLQQRSVGSIKLTGTKEFVLILLQIVQMMKLMEINVMKNAIHLETVINAIGIKLVLSVLIKHFMVLRVKNSVNFVQIIVVI